MNAGRFVLAGFVAAIICFVTDGFMHNVLLDADWKAIYAGVQGMPPGEHEHSPLAFVWFALFELGRGYIAITFHVLLRERMGKSAKTAAVAGVLSWVAFSLTGPVQMIPLKLFSVALWVKMAAVQLVTSLVAAVAGGAVYKD